MVYKHGKIFICITKCQASFATEFYFFYDIYLFRKDCDLIQDLEKQQACNDTMAQLLKQLNMTHKSKLFHAYCTYF